jgi:hypothetical protein
MPPDNTVMVQGARLVFRNFTGRPGKYNQEGERGFAVVIPDDLANTLLEDGWNVKRFKPREDEDEGEPTEYYLPVVVKYRNLKGEPVRPPRIVTISDGVRKNLEEHEVEALDWVEIVNVDLIVRPYPWGPINGKYGTTAYLQSLFVTIQEDALEKKYRDLEQRD